MSDKNEEIVVLAPGVFDVLHEGHIEILRFAKSLGTKLIVAINTDRTVKLFKGPDRPLRNELDRKKALEEFDFVDEVIIYDDPKPELLIKSLNPHIVIKGNEKTAQEFRELDHIPEHIQVITFPLILNESGEKHSSTELIKILKVDDINQ